MVQNFQVKVVDRAKVNKALWNSYTVIKFGKMTVFNES